jgi:hypothetical protein
MFAYNLLAFCVSFLENYGEGVQLWGQITHTCRVLLEATISVFTGKPLGPEIESFPGPGISGMAKFVCARNVAVYF